MQAFLCLEGPVAECYENEIITLGNPAYPTRETIQHLVNNFYFALVFTANNKPYMCMLHFSTHSKSYPTDTSWVSSHIKFIRNDQEQCSIWQRYQWHGRRSIWLLWAGATSWDCYSSWPKRDQGLIYSQPEQSLGDGGIPSHDWRGCHCNSQIVPSISTR